MEAGPHPPGFHLHIDNAPWMPLDIEDIEISGPNGLPTVSVAHYGKQNGDAMRDPEMLFEMRRDGSEIVLAPYYWRNDYLGIEQYSSYRDESQKLFTLSALKQQHEAFARTWDRNLRSQGFYEAFVHSGSRKSAIQRAGTGCARPRIHSRQPHKENPHDNRSSNAIRVSQPAACEPH